MLANGMPIVVLCLISSVVYVEAFSFQFLKTSADEGKSTKLEASSVNDFGENDLQPDRLEQDYSQKRSIPSKKAVVGSKSNLETESDGEKAFTIWDALDVSNREDSVENNTKTDNSSSLPSNASVQVKQDSEEDDDDDDDDDDESEKPKPVNGQDVPKNPPKQSTQLNVLPSGELNLDVGGQAIPNTSVQKPSENNQSLNNTENPQTGGPDPYVFGNTSNTVPSNTSQSQTPVVNVEGTINSSVAVPNNQSNVSVEGQSNSSISNQPVAVNETGPVSSNQSAVVGGELGLSVNISNSTLPAENVTQPESPNVTVKVEVVLVNSSSNGTNSTPSNISEPSSVGNVSNSNQVSLNTSASPNSTASGEGVIVVSLNVSQPANVSLSGDINSTLPIKEKCETTVAAGSNESKVNVSVTESANTSSNVSDAVGNVTNVVVGENSNKTVALNVSETIPQNSTQSQNTSINNENNTLVLNVSGISNTSSAGNISLEGYKNKTKTPFNITLLDISGNADSQKTDVDLQSESNVTVSTNQSLSLNSSASGNSSASVEVSSEVSKNNTKNENDVKEDANVRVKRKTIAKRSVNPVLVERRKRDSYKENEEFYSEEADHKFNNIIN